MNIEGYTDSTDSKAGGLKGMARAQGHNKTPGGLTARGVKIGDMKIFRVQATASPVSGFFGR